MKSSSKLKLWAFFWVVIVVFLFVLFSYFIQTKLGFFEGLMVNGVLVMVIYVLLKITATVFAPVSALPFIVVAVGLWGFWMAVFLTVLGWTLGGVIAFVLARKFGVPIIKRLIPLEDVYKFEEKISIGNNFWSVVFLRMVVPVDVLSYGLGLFSKIDFWKYTLATGVGVIPFAVAFAYLGEVPYVYLIILGLGFLIGVLVLLIFREIKGK